MGLVLNKLGRIARHSFAANPVVYRTRKMLLSRAGSDSLPGVDEARERMLALRPPLAIPLPTRHCSWPEKPAVDITVIVPCYNAERFVYSSLCSVLDQECDATFEVIAVDDGSTDGTSLILDTLAAGDGRLSVIRQTNKGFSGARNAGLRAARGSTIAFVNADDMLAPGALKVLYGELKRSHADYVTGRYRFIDECDRLIPTRKRRPSGVAWGRIFDREVWRGLEFPEGVWFEDTVHAYMISPVYREATVDDVVYSYRKQSGSITLTSRSSKRSVDTLFVTEAMLDWRNAAGLPIDQRIYDQTLYQLGSLLMNRTVALDGNESMCCFVLASNLLKSLEKRTSYSSEIWLDLESALLTGDYKLWRLAASSI